LVRGQGDDPVGQRREPGEGVDDAAQPGQGGSQEEQFY
jgi:hypothetical protein